MPTIRETITSIRNDVPNKSILSFLKLYFFNPGFRVLLNHRIGKYLYNSKFLILRQVGNYYKIKLITKRNCDISYSASIGKNVRFPHPIGIVIGEGVIIGDNVKIWQQVTLGSHGRGDSLMAYPKIEREVKIFAGAKVFGGVIVGSGSVIGANSVVNIDVPSNSVAVGIPCRIINKSK